MLPTLITQNKYIKPTKTGELEEAHYLINDYGNAITTIINLKDLKTVRQREQVIEKDPS